MAVLCIVQGTAMDYFDRYFRPHIALIAVYSGASPPGGWGDTPPPRSVKPVGGGGIPPGIDDLPTFLTGMKNFEIENRPF